MRIKKTLDLLGCDIKSFIDKVASMLNDANYKTGVGYLTGICKE